MFKHIYVEEAVLEHPRTQALCARYPQAQVIPCAHYGEIFNRKNQSFRLQKKQPALILAHKQGQLVHPTPEHYGIGRPNNYYFSHLLNCPYDCRYCFLQGMYNSAHYLLFVNYEDFQLAIEEKLTGEKSTFFSGYDCDSLAMDPITHFLRSFLPFFAKYPEAELELRSKSAQVGELLRHPTLPNVVCAFTLSPDPVAKGVEHRAPALHLRLRAMERLQEKGWTLGLRFDPVIYHEGYRSTYSALFREVFQRLSLDSIHSISLGVFRMPKRLYQSVAREHPDSKLFSTKTVLEKGEISYSPELREEMLNFCLNELKKYAPDNKIHPCSGT